MLCFRSFRSTFVFGLGVFLLGFFVICKPVLAQVQPACFVGGKVVSSPFEEYVYSGARAGVKAYSDALLASGGKSQLFSSVEWLDNNDIIVCFTSGIALSSDDSRDFKLIMLSGGRFFIFHLFCGLMTYLFCMR